jgi:hypothetical protein
MKNITIISVDKRQELFGLDKIESGQLVYVVEDNLFYHLKDWSRRNKSGAWRPVNIPPATSISIGGIQFTTESSPAKFLREDGTWETP